MNSFFVVLIQIASQAITILIIVYVILSYFLSPYHPIRQTIDRLVEPLLAPIRQILPQTGMIDFSPLVLLILVQLISALLLQLLNG
ncbi:MAG: YggT family protein [Anaerolineales bacterium]